MADESIQNVVITGAAGGIGSVLRAPFRERFARVRLSDIRPILNKAANEEVVPADLADLDAVRGALRGMDGVVHLGGIPVEADWASILQVNVLGTVNLFEAARLEGVSRVVFASTNHVVGFHRRARTIDPASPVRPDTRYGVSKLFGEGVGRLYADKHGLSVVCLRIGSFQPRPQDERMLSTWLSHRDGVHLIERALLARDVHFEILYGLSANARAFWVNPRAAHFGYAPQDNAEDYAQEILQAGIAEPEIDRQFHGGSFCGIEFDADPAAID